MWQDGKLLIGKQIVYVKNIKEQVINIIHIYLYYNSSYNSVKIY